MTRLHSELTRLYLAPAAPDTQPQSLVSPSGTVRAMVLELTRPPRWDELSKVWYGVQTDLELPAPAIAVSGTDGLQLWFSLAEPIAAPRAHAFLQGLRQRFLPDVESARMRLMPSPAASVLQPECHARLVPAEQEPAGNWSAFVAPDLAPVFDDTPWLDIPPGEEAQAKLLRGIEVTPQAAFEAAMAKLAPAPPSPAASAEPPRSAVLATDDPKRFLLQVMHDASVPLALRIDAAKALLPYAERSGD